MSNTQAQSLCMQAITVVKATGAFIATQRGKVAESAIETKSINSLVSYVDQEAERQLVSGLGALLPEAVFLTEEETVAQEEGQYRWIIDPLDGTTNFLHQLPFFSISVALQREGRSILGIVYEVNREECFYAWQGGGAYLNTAPIRTRPVRHLADTLVATGFPYYDYSRQGAYLEVLGALMQRCRGIRRLGSAALDLAYVACGRFDFFFEHSLNAWDVAAGAFLVEEAGGKVSDFRGGEDYLLGREIVASAAGVYAEGMAVLEPLGRKTVENGDH
ncbi:MAG: inositol monophosphatase family protein [Bacteroidota bacterium]